MVQAGENEESIAFKQTMLIPTNINTGRCHKP